MNNIDGVQFLATNVDDVLWFMENFHGQFYLM